ncbi:hypothetical protein DB032_17860 [Chromobacterium sp. Panama]|nr:hypothetical protein DB032_17860 [Chromobacterium sp. Panama]
MARLAEQGRFRLWRRGAGRGLAVDLEQRRGEGGWRGGRWKQWRFAVEKRLDPGLDIQAAQQNVFQGEGKGGGESVDADESGALRICFT